MSDRLRLHIRLLLQDDCAYRPIAKKMQIQILIMMMMMMRKVTLRQFLTVKVDKSFNDSIVRQFADADL